ncbi:MAG: hypothetical protein IH988_11275 [Planctomycetes bacterium]|nr:hypothetical protein [Planctomycetota bacterium]
MVKLPEQRRWTRTTAISFASTLAIAASILFAWRFWHDQPAVVAVQRDISDVRVWWRCPDDHRFTALGATVARICPKCDQAADVALEYLCRDHGRVEVLLRYQRTPDGRAKPASYSADGSQWAPMGDTPLCPICSEPLSRGRRFLSDLTSNQDAPQ